MDFRRPSSHIIRIPLDELGEPGPVMVPELIAAGVDIEVVDPGVVPSVGALPDLPEHLVADLPAEMREQLQKVGAGARDDGVLLAIRADGVHADIVGDDGRPFSGGSGHSGSLRWWRRSDGGSPGAAAHLEVRLPVMSRSDESDGLAALRQALADHAPDLAVEHLARFRPATALVPHRVSSADDIPIGASRLNGEPDLPPDMTWPSWDGPPGEASTRGGPAWLPPHHWGPGPLTFLAQINLAELPPAARSIPLPNDGWLLFFADQDRSTFYSGEEQAAQRVIHLPAGTHLERRSLPQDVRYGRSEDGTWPGYGAPASIAHRTISTPPYDDLYRLVDGLDPAGARELAHVLYATSIASDSFQLGGWPVPIQEDPLRSTPHMVRSLAESDPGTWSELADPAVEWVLLFQYVTDRSLDMMLGDEGNLYFMAAMPDLERGDFSRVVVEFQCS